MSATAKALREVFSVLNAPKAMQPDNGSGFINQVIEELAKLNGINPRAIFLRSPGANGQAERVNKIIEAAIKKQLEGAMHKWPECAPYAQLSRNAKGPTTTGSAHFTLMSGQRLNDVQKHGKPQ